MKRHRDISSFFTSVPELHSGQDAREQSNGQLPARPVPATLVPATLVPATLVPATFITVPPVPAITGQATPVPATPVPAIHVPATSVPVTSVPSTPAPDTHFLAGLPVLPPPPPTANADRDVVVVFPIGDIGYAVRHRCSGGSVPADVKAGYLKHTWRAPPNFQWPTEARKTKGRVTNYVQAEVSRF